MLAMATDIRDHSTGDHIWRVTEFVRVLTWKLLDKPDNSHGLSFDQVQDIVKASKLHDLGKIAIPDQILRKADKLTAGEFEIVKEHPLQGARFLDGFADPLGDDVFLSIARDIALYHHEKWDGTGYPTGLMGEDIPLSARIVAIADVYDALISIRPYKKAFTHEDSVEIIINDSERHFDPYLVELFGECTDVFKPIPEEAIRRSRKSGSDGEQKWSTDKGTGL
ncbi:HD-GYP domain-containing protein [Breznakiella homolactica]|uniref:HD domain-containing protein n=1 Tax=Breznakiella homolactica TaxID=2798577 RepID=A0A7T7XMQ3_9SPIR|nr:HD domain-containing phosphohydrolase [Breznakiella homolactica]QQO09073.1 HD domain-containing protein [Breznakiella homolactica]